MPQLKLSIPHGLSEEEALKRIKKLIKKVKGEYAEKISNVQEEWKGNKGTFNFKTLGFPITGTLMVKSKKVELDGVIPFAATFFKSMIERILREKAKEVLS